jgi:hypothetical protein
MLPAFSDGFRQLSRTCRVEFGEPKAVLIGEIGQVFQILRDSTVER